MYQVFNTVTGEPQPVLSEAPYDLAGPLAERLMVQKTDEDGNLIYLKRVQTDVMHDDGQDYDEIVEYVETTETGEMWEALLDYEGNEVSPEEWKAYPPVMVDGGPLYEWCEVVPTDAEVLEAAKSTKLADISAKLAALDLFLPRALEDYWTTIEFDTTTLPKVQQDRLARKNELRLAYSATQVATNMTEIVAINV